jgi:hypothetical protein
MIQSRRRTSGIKRVSGNVRTNGRKLLKKLVEAAGVGRAGVLKTEQLLWHVLTLDLDFALVLPSGGKIVSKLHPATTHPALPLSDSSRFLEMFRTTKVAGYGYFFRYSR